MIMVTTITGGIDATDVTELTVTIIFGIISVGRILEPVVIGGGGNVGRHDLRLTAGVGRHHLHRDRLGRFGRRYRLRCN
jgi:hypothetical protein